MTESRAGLYSLAVSPSGELVVAAGEDKMIRVWTISENGGTLSKSAFAHNAAILDLGFTPDGKTLVSSGADKQVKFWDVATMEEIRVLPNQSDWVLTLAVSPDGKELVLGRYDGSIERIILSAEPSS
jgi:WD40 repeat protein